MFGYIVHKRRFKQKLGDYISHSIVDTDKSILRTKVLPTTKVDELNSLDRYELARVYLDDYKSRSYNYKDDSIYNCDMLEKDVIKDIAVYIDNLIPKFCVKKLEGREESATTYYVKNGTYGLFYYYDVNKEGNPPSSLWHNYITPGLSDTDSITCKQLSYLEDLAKDSGYRLKSEDIGKKSASLLISFLKGDCSEEPECLFEYLEYDC